jgi:hypothetical protein
MRCISITPRTHPRTRPLKGKGTKAYTDNVTGLPGGGGGGSRSTLLGIALLCNRFRPRSTAWLLALVPKLSATWRHCAPNTNARNRRAC